MDFPSDVAIRASLKRGAVYYFKEESISSEKPHYFVVLNDGSCNSQLIILACAQSQVEKRMRARRNLPQETLVVLPVGRYDYFTEETVFDCNSIFKKGITDLIDKHACGILGVCGNEMPSDIVDRLVAGALASPLVPEEIKEQLSA